MAGIPMKVWSRPVTRPVARPASRAMKKRCPDVHAGEQAHNADRAAGGKRAVHRQIRHVKDAVGDIYADRHDAPDEALRTGTGQGTGQVGKSCKNIQNVFLL